MCATGRSFCFGRTRGRGTSINCVAQSDSMRNAYVGGTKHNVIKKDRQQKTHELVAKHVQELTWIIASVELEEVAEVTLLPVVEVPPVLVPAEELPVTCPSMAPGARPSHHNLHPLPLTHCPQQSHHLQNRLHPGFHHLPFSTTTPLQKKTRSCQVHTRKKMNSR